MKTKNAKLNGTGTTKGRPRSLTYEEFCALDPPQWTLDAIWEHLGGDGYVTRKSRKLQRFMAEHGIREIGAPSQWTPSR